MLLSFYVGCALVTAVVVFVVATRTWDHGDPSDRRGRVARTFVVAAFCGLLWPSAVMVAVIWLFPTGRRWLDWWMEGPASGQRFGSWLRQGPPKPDQS